MGIVSLKYDYFFKYLMTNEKIVRHFLSDVLDIPLEEIKSVRLANTFLWKRYYRQKQGILDILLILNDDSKINIELQIKIIKYWDRRCLFYLSKMFTEDLQIGEKYSRLKKCVNISILDFCLNEDAEYHHIYHLRDKNGKLFSDLFEIHIIELGKELDGAGPIDDWIRLFNAETEEDLNMLSTKNAGIAEAVREVRHMSFSRRLRLLYEARMKEIRDRNARDEYVWDEGVAAGQAQGKAEGIAIGQAQGEAKGIAIGQAQGGRKKLVSLVRRKAEKGMSAAQIADLLEEDQSLIAGIFDTIQNHPDWEDDRI